MKQTPRFAASDQYEILEQSGETAHSAMHTIIFELIRVKIKLWRIGIDNIINLPMMINKEKIRIIESLIDAGVFVSYKYRNLFTVSTLKGVNMMLSHGNTHASDILYMALACIIGGAQGDFPTAYRIGEMALKLNEKLDAKKNVCKVNFLFAYYIQHWLKHIRNSIDFYYKAYQHGIDTGDLSFSGYCVNEMAQIRLLAGNNIDDILDKHLKYKDFMKGMKDIGTYMRFIETIQICHNLNGTTKSILSLNSQGYDQEEHLMELRKRNDKLGIFCHLLAREKMYYLFGDYEEAIKVGDELDGLLKYITGVYYIPDHYFHRSLVILADSKNMTDQRKNSLFGIVKRFQKKMKKFSELCPENFLHKYLLVEAELAAVKNRHLEAQELYHSAIKSAHANGFLQNEALAFERAGLYYISRGYNEIAQGYISGAHKAYKSWGANAKVKELEDKHAQHILRQAAAGGTDTDTTTKTSLLDLSTVMEASQAISSEIMLERLLQKIIHLSVGNAGAQKGYLLLETEGRLTIEASEDVQSGETKVLQSMELETCEGIPTAIVQHVFHSNEDVILSDAMHEGRFANEAYIQKNKCKSMLCVPISNKGRILGIMYMENNLTADVFTPERLQLLRIILTQAAISLENAKLFELATTDGLTKLYIHRYFQLLLDQEINRTKRYHQPLSIIIADIDNFKNFNEIYGHKLGDEVLRLISQVMKMNTREVDIVARYGGEEFIVILPETDIEGALVAAEKIRKKVEELEVEYEGQKLHTTISMGLATFPRHAGDKDTFIKSADSALYVSKRAGKNRVSVAAKG